MKKIVCEKIGDSYISKEEYTYYSPRYKKSITVPDAYPSNGANYVEDLHPTAFFVHDRGCEYGKWDDGSKMCNRELSFIYYDILRYFKTWWPRSAWRWLGTFFGGGGEAKKNGWFKVKI